MPDLPSLLTHSTRDLVNDEESVQRNSLTERNRRTIFLYCSPSGKMTLSTSTLNPPCFKAAIVLSKYSGAIVSLVTIKTFFPCTCLSTHQQRKAINHPKTVRFTEALNDTCGSMMFIGFRNPSEDSRDRKLSKFAERRKKRRCSTLQLSVKDTIGLPQRKMRSTIALAMDSKPPFGL